MLRSVNIAHTIMKIRYEDLNYFLSPVFKNGPEPVNLYINYESVLSFLSRQFDIDNTLEREKSLDRSMLGELLNLAAHYKRFFVGNHCNVKVFFYYTDLNSKKFPAMKDIVSDYRSRYLNKFNKNVAYTKLGSVCINTVIPYAENICRFIPDVYFLKATDFEGSIIPGFVSSLYPNRRNIIVSNDIYDTQYMVENGFTVLYIRRSFHTHKMDKIVNPLVVANKILNYEEVKAPEFLGNFVYYKLLLSSVKNQRRNIPNIKGYGPRTITKYYEPLITQSKLPREPRSENYILSKVKDVNVANEIKRNYQAYDIHYHFNLLEEYNAQNLLSNIVDSFDYNSLLKLNKFYMSETPIRLDDLTAQAR